MRLTTLSLAIVATLSAALPTQHPNTEDNLSKRMISTLTFKQPWILSNITVNHAISGNSSVTFKFCDTNIGLELDTECNYSVNSSRQLDSPLYHDCINETVRFIYNSKEFKIARTYRDDDLGRPPYNYGTAFGNAFANLTKENTTDGTRLTQKDLRIPITSLIAKK